MPPTGALYRPTKTFPSASTNTGPQSLFHVSATAALANVMPLMIAMVNNFDNAGMKVFLCFLQEISFL